MIHNYSYKIQALKKRSAAHLIKYVSIDVYNRIGFVHKHKSSRAMIRIGEETLTENLVYELHKFTLDYGLPLVRLFESVGEDTNGADILLDIPVGNNYIRVPVQAKKITPHANRTDGSYKSFRHANSNGLQSDLLKDYADKIGSYLPIYFLYNFTLGNRTNIQGGEKEYYYGISYFNLNSKTKKPLPNTVRFSHLHSVPAKPLYKLFEKSGGGSGNGGSGRSGGNPPPETPSNPEDDGIRELYKRFGMDITDDFLHQVRRYTQDEIFTDTDNWTDIFFGEEPLKGESAKSAKNSIEFKPRYRLVLLSDPMVEEHVLQMTLTDGGGAKIWEDDEVDPFIEHSPSVEEYTDYKVYC